MPFESLNLEHGIPSLRAEGHLELIWSTYVLVLVQLQYLYIYRHMYIYIDMCIQILDICIFYIHMLYNSCTYIFIYLYTYVCVAMRGRLMVRFVLQGLLRLWFPRQAGPRPSELPTAQMRAGVLVGGWWGSYAIKVPSLELRLRLPIAHLVFWGPQRGCNSDSQPGMYVGHPPTASARKTGDRGTNTFPSIHLREIVSIRTRSIYLVGGVPMGSGRDSRKNISWLCQQVHQLGSLPLLRTLRTVPATSYSYSPPISRWYSCQEHFQIGFVLCTWR